jgi:hypothetical protein
MRNIVVVGLALSVAVGAFFIFVPYGTHLRGEPLLEALRPVIESKDPDKSLAAKSLLSNYLETRQIAAMWSGLYWGFAWISAVLGALAGFILKAESIDIQEKTKKDAAAFMAVAAALLVTISTSGDFQRKWQANRTAAAELERAAYDFLEKDGAEPRTYLGRIGDSLHRRHMSILGTVDQSKVGTIKPTGGASGTR